ncbi:TIGR01459 family HAD-type hydrolase [Palleronia sp. LCG004]|uniref:TIGR01459 family HAD-type hydrolase n=1 Tax=Palleronia sp. LCG004 TaxID=3079304 RepID=UPI002941CC5C|nr:TIGR01459 family HAD-type hydrolase [Palleronia sp. LCG004]WOI56453.1 TIGR01459 family HAD-type hydrolase [Palleronia sp. LCG004]
MTRIIEALEEISDEYDALFCDLWGCVHDGIAALPEAVEALRAYRARGGSVVLLTNAPRPRASVALQIEALGVPDDAWDTIATSGDAARDAMFRGAVGSRIYFMGEERDHVFFEPIATVEDPVAIERVPLGEAEGIVVTGPFDPSEPPEAVRPQLLSAKARGLKLLSANPDIVVDKGDKREFCGGAIAELYKSMGGEVLSFGKPHPPVYDLARRRLAEFGDPVPDERILAIGDGIATDVLGGALEGLDVLFVSGGLALKETATERQPEPEALDRFLDTQRANPEFTIGKLR